MAPDATPVRRRPVTALVAVVLACAAVALACAPAPPTGRQVPSAPVWPRTADPSVLVEGGTWWVYASNNGRHLPATPTPAMPASAPVAPADEWRWMAATGEAMATMPAWASSWSRWAPSVARLGGRYVMWFATDRTGAPNPANSQCVGRAFATSPQGPFVPEPRPFSCGLDGWRGALDPQVFVAPDNKVYLLVAFSDTEAPLYVIELTGTGDPVAWRADGQAAYRPQPVLGKRWAWEGRFIENPSMVYDPVNRNYLLAYSAGDWWTAGYSTGLARCTSPVGPCSSSSQGPWLASGNGRTGVGGLSFFTDAAGTARAVYSSYAPGVEGTGSRRAASVAVVRFDGQPRLVP